MDLRNNQITVKELLAHPGAMSLAKREFPKLLDSSLKLKMAGGMTLEQVLKMAGKLPQERVEKLLEELKAL